MAGRPRKPTALLKARGAFAHNPDRGREREGEIVPAGELGGPPDYLSPGEKAAWLELTSRAFPGLLKEGDEFVMEMAAGLIAEYREKRTQFNKHNQMLSVLDRLGLTPGGRSSIKDPNGGTKTKRGFGALRAGGRA